MTLDELFGQAAGDLSKFPRAVITIQASVMVSRWLAGLIQPTYGDNLNVANLQLVGQYATGTLTYKPGNITPVKGGEIFTPASFSGQVASDQFLTYEGEKDISYSYALFITVNSSTPLAPNSVQVTLTHPVLKPPPMVSYSNLFTTPGGSYVFFQQAEPIGQLIKFVSVQLDDYTLYKPAKKPKISPIVPGIVGMIFGGVAVDGGGTIIVGGVPGPVPPWGPILAETDPATGDLLIGIALDEIAKSISDMQARSAIRGAIVSEMRKSVGLIAKSVHDGAKSEDVKAEIKPSKGDA